MKLSAIFPNASQSCQKANPQLGLGGKDKNALAGRTGTRRGIPNKTEAEFALRLEAMKRNGEILRYEFEGITLRWAGMRYTPDFVVFEQTDSVMREGHDFITRIKLIEVKGGHIWDRDIVRFKGARAHWPEFAFEMWQKKAGQWKRIH